MTTQRRPARRNQSRDLIGRLATQSGPRTTAPMWARALFTPGEWAVYTALWSYPNDSVIPTYQDLCNRAWVERPTAIAAVTKMNDLGLLEKEASEREADGGQSSNTYYLIEVPTADLLKKIAELTAQRQKDQDGKRKKRKANNRKYEKPQATAPDGGDIPVAPLSMRQGGSMEIAPRGVDADITPGGSVEITPQGVDGERTHEVSLGVDVVGKGTVRTSSSSAEHGQNRSEPTAEEEIDFPSEHEAQESDPDPRDFNPTLTKWEQALHAEILPMRPDWSARQLKQAIGLPVVRERTAQSPELVRRAFLLAAADKAKVEVGYRGTWSPWRFKAPGCPHWAAAAAQIEAEAGRSGEPVDDVPAAGGPAGTDGAPQAAGAGMYVGPVGERRPMPAQRSERSSDVAALFAQGGFRFGAEQESTAR